MSNKRCEQGSSSHLHPPHSEDVWTNLASLSEGV